MKCFVLITLTETPIIAATSSERLLSQTILRDHIYSISIASPRPELARVLLISERLRNVAAPRPVFLNSSLNILNSFWLSGLVRSSRIYLEKLGVISIPMNIRFVGDKYLDFEVVRGRRSYEYKIVSSRVVSRYPVL